MLDRYLFRILLSALLLFGRPVIAAEQRPNVVIILTDDQGFADVGVYGAAGYKTSHLDRMAAAGLRLTSFYSTQPVCSASRAALLTGCYPNRVGIRGALEYHSEIGLNPYEKTLAEILKEVGYATGIFGKWHLGDHVKFLPPEHGFDESLTIPYSNDMWPVGYDGEPLPAHHRKAKYPPLPLLEGKRQISAFRTPADQSKMTRLFTERAVGFIEKHQQGPFFLLLAHPMPHVPLAVSSEFRGKSEQGMYGDVIMEIDWSVGEITGVLERLGLSDNTLMIFISDNGPWLNFGNHAGSAGPFREGKKTSWEGGLRVPCIIKWPKVIGAGQVHDWMAASIDLLPTITSFVRGRLPANTIDGIDLSALLRGLPGARSRDRFFYYFANGGSFDQLQAVRLNEWKLILPHEYQSYDGVPPGRDGRPGPGYYALGLGGAGPFATWRVGLELYNLEQDVAERKNLADQHPDIVERMNTLAREARDELGDRKVKGKGVRPVGRVTWDDN